MNTLATRKHALGGNHRSTRTSLAMLALIGTTALAWGGVATAADTLVRDLGVPPAGNPHAEGEFNRAEEGWLAANDVGGSGQIGAAIKDMGAAPTGNPYAEGFEADGGGAVTDRLRGEGPALANEMTPPAGNPNAEGYDLGVGNHDGELFAGDEGKPSAPMPGAHPQVAGDMNGQLVATGRIETLQMQGDGGAITLDNGETYVLNTNEPRQGDLNEGALVTFAYNIDGDHNRVVGTPEILE